MPDDFPALAPEDEIRYFEARGQRLSPTFAWQDFFQQDHAAAFTVAKSAGFDILKDINDALIASAQNGTTFDTFKTQLTPILQAKGWWGKALVTDPAEPDEGPKLVQLGSTRRLETIFNTNMRVAHAAGRWNQIRRTIGTRPYLRYTAILDSRTRPMHRAWHGTILPADHPWWQTHFPPCGWNCRCSVQSLSDADLARYGFSVNDAAPDNGPAIRYVNPRTGEVAEVPPGIDPGWGYNPGSAAIDVHAARVSASKWIDNPPPFTAAEQAASIRFMLPLLTQDYAAWVDTVEAGGGKAIGEQRVVGALSQEALDFLKAHDVDPVSGAITINDRTVLHMLRDAKIARASATPIADLTNLPEILADPTDILWDQQDPALLYVFEPTGFADKSGKIVVRIDIADKVARQTVISNAVRSGGLVQPENLDRNPRYVVVTPQSPGGTPPSP